MGGSKDLKRKLLLLPIVIKEEVEITQGRFFE